MRSSREGRCQGGAAADGEGGCTPLHWAAISGHEEAVQVLLGAGAAVAAKNITRLTALDYAAVNRREGVARVLRDAGAAQAASAPDGVAEVPVGALSAQAGAHAASAPAVAQLLGQADAERGRMVETPWRAVQEGEIEEVRQLIAGGADGGAENPGGWTALHLAAWVGFAQVLLDAGADVAAAETGRAGMLRDAVATQISGTPGFIDQYYQTTHHFDASCDGFSFGVVKP
ncbi:ankyrin repeat-containing domain protein [Baffinella frigidus]|nr:ankyrin repeat-containing domain protein [Cryptophyta sp. CCMP2293]